ncbi:MAG: thioredoxin family protein [Planctomycetota bacterium]|nr:thioredoxin family protein [Planctomycetota bacterium]
MWTRCLKVALLTFTMLLCLSVNATGARAAKFNRILDIGAKAPEWKDLRGTDGRSHSLADHKEAKAIVVVFTCNHCPVAQAYEERLITLAKRNKKEGVTTIAISVSRYEADDFESMKKRAKDRKYPFAYLQDTSQKTGQDYGALATPQVFLLDRDRRVAYMGSIDDSMHPGKVTERFLQQAIDAVLINKPVEVEETKPIGCPIFYDRHP